MLSPLLSAPWGEKLRKNVGASGKKLSSGLGNTRMENLLNKEWIFDEKAFVIYVPYNAYWI